MIIKSIIFEFHEYIIKINNKNNLPESSKYYHIHHHANGFENIFKSEENYRFFLEKYKFYISPVANTLAYCLMPNHFHFLIKIKSEEELKGVLSGGKNPQGLTEPKPLQNLEGFEMGDGVYNKLTGQQFSKRFVYLTIEKLIYRVQINS